jgi:hypothetical protein
MPDSRASILAEDLPQDASETSSHKYGHNVSMMESENPNIKSGHSSQKDRVHGTLTAVSA